MNELVKSFMLKRWILNVAATLVSSVSPLLAASLYYKKLLDFVCLCWIISVVLNYILWLHGYYFFVECELRRSKSIDLKWIFWFALLQKQFCFLICILLQQQAFEFPVLVPEVICLEVIEIFGSSAQENLIRGIFAWLVSHVEFFCAGKSDSGDVGKTSILHGWLAMLNYDCLFQILSSVFILLIKWNSICNRISKYQTKLRPASDKPFFFKLPATNC